MIHSDSTAHVEASQPPVHCLSYDDLHLIFSLCWNPSADNFPIIASHVCHRWRWFILDMPVFWSHIRFHHREPRLSMERYATWVQRSKDVQLDISINEKPFAEFTFENIEAIMELIGPHMERWRSLQIDRVSLQNIHIFLNHLQGRSLPLLRGLRIVESRKGFCGSDGPGLLGQLVIDAPQLREVDLVGFVADFDSPLFHNLHALHLKGNYLARFKFPVVKDLVQTLLRQSPHLKQLHIRNPILDLRVPPPKTRYTPSANEELFSHASLVDLTLDHLVALHDAIIPSTRFPALRSLGCRPGLTLASWHLPLLVRNSPFPSLTKIDLSGLPSGLQHERYLADALSTLASLEQLRLDRFDMTLAVNALPTLGYSCPKLRVLTLYQCKRLEINQVRSLVDTRLQVDGMTGLQDLRIFGGIDDAFPGWEATETWLKERVELVSMYKDSGWV